MKIGLIDVDGHNFPNLPLMKLSAWHKACGDSVEWYNPLISGKLDRVYMSKVFTFTPDYQYFIQADEIIKSGTGYYYPDGGSSLPQQIENHYPDYALYPGLTDNTAYGFLTRGCPRKCPFCIVGDKEGTSSHKVADLEQFWKGQARIKLLDPNILACKSYKDLFEQLIYSKALIDFTQGIDARLLTEESIDLLNKIRMRRIHFAWDNIADEKYIIPKLKLFSQMSNMREEDKKVYVLTNYNTSHQEDLYRVERLRELEFDPYIMIYEKEKLPSRHITRKLQRYVNNKIIFRSCWSFSDYQK